jgi:hypothetical protein
MTFRPVPVGFPGLQTTSIDSISAEDLASLSLSRACSDATLNSSEPQKRMRRGSNWRTLDWKERHWSSHGLFVAMDRNEEKRLMAALCYSMYWSKNNNNMNNNNNLEAI